MGAVPSALGQVPGVVRDLIPSAEQSGVKCGRCSRDLPRNNWSFYDHARDLGFIAFYETTAEGRRVVKYVRLIENPHLHHTQWDFKYSCLACLKKNDEGKFMSVKMAISGHAVLFMDD